LVVLKGLDPIEEEINSRPGLYRSKTAALPDLSPEAFNATVRATSLCQRFLVPFLARGG
jgi:hypothetical protein